MKIKTSELEGVALDWATGVSLGHKVQYSNNVGGLSISEPYSQHDQFIWSPSTDWGQGGPLIEECGVTIIQQGAFWCADLVGGGCQYSESPLIAACRAIAVAKLDEEVDVPEELLS